MSARAARRIRVGIEAANGIARDLRDLDAASIQWLFWHLVQERMPGSLFDNDALTLKAYMRRAEHLASRMRP